MGGLWTLVTILGPVLLLAVLAYVLVRNRHKPGPGEEERLDRATKALRDDLDREDKARASDPGA